MLKPDYETAYSSLLPELQHIGKRSCNGENAQCVDEKYDKRFPEQIPDTFRWTTGGMVLHKLLESLQKG